jgi:hypothetical protein
MTVRVLLWSYAQNKHQSNKNADCPVPRTVGVFYVEKLLLRRDFEDHTVALGAAVLGRTVEFALI